MDDERRRVYRALGWGFVVVGLVFAALSVAERFLQLGLLRGNALSVALFLIVIGVALLMTVRGR